MVYLPEAERSQTNKLLLVVSALGFAIYLIEQVLKLRRRSKLLAQAADGLELAAALYTDGKITGAQFLKQINEGISTRLQQHDD